MDIFDRVNNLKDDDLFTLLAVLTCPEGQEEEIYNKRRSLNKEKHPAGRCGDSRSAAAE
jgi:hypothetical protein